MLVKKSKFGYILAISLVLTLLLTSCSKTTTTTATVTTTKTTSSTTTTAAAPAYKVPSIPIVNGPIASPSNANHALGMLQVSGVPSGPTDFAYPKLPAGYSEAEYFFSDTASIYEWVDPKDPKTTIRPVTGYTDIPYTTRMMVIYPTDAKNFSGNVFVNPMNPSTGHDLFVPWERSSDYFVRSGDAYVGWTCKSVCVAALQAWNPTRYASLDWPYKPYTPGNNTAKYDGLTFEMAYQIGALFKTNADGSPLKSYNVKRVYEAGFSQDGGFISTQITAFQHYFRLSDGSSVYDGYSPQGNTGGVTPTNMASVSQLLTPNGILSVDNPKCVVSGSDVPVIFIDTENEVKWATIPGQSNYNPWFTRADSDDPNDLFLCGKYPVTVMLTMIPAALPVSTS